MKLEIRIKNLSLTIFEDGSASIFCEKEVGGVLTTLSKDEIHKIKGLIDLAEEA
jgi:hypothetical protein